MSIESRLAAGERWAAEHTPSRIFVIADTGSGEVEMSVDELLSSGAEFVRVTRGNSLADLDKILLAIRSHA